MKQMLPPDIALDETELVTVSSTDGPPYLCQQRWGSSAPHGSVPPYWWNIMAQSKKGSSILKSLATRHLPHGLSPEPPNGKGALYCNYTAVGLLYFLLMTINIILETFPCEKKNLFPSLRSSSCPSIFQIAWMFYIGLREPYRAWTLSNAVFAGCEKSWKVLQKQLAWQRKPFIMRPKNSQRRSEHMYHSYTLNRKSMQNPIALISYILHRSAAL